MRITITTTEAAVYKFAGSTVADNVNGIYRGRLINQLNLARSFSDLGSNLATLTLQLINHDKIIPDNVNLWGASVEVETVAGHNWIGKITAYESSADGKLIVTATERTVPELSQYLPDEFIKLTTVTSDVHSSSLKATIPLVVGGSTASPIDVKGILKSKTDGIYYLCVGEIHEIVNVRVGDKTLTRAEAESAGYMTYTGSASQSLEPGIAYIQITDPNLRKNDDGTYVEIGAGVVGLKLGTHTADECRNGARFLLWLLKTARVGACEWGLGISESDIDLATFTTAIADVDAEGLKLDGVIYDRRVAQSWINEICRCIRGSYEIGENGKRRLFISKASDTSSYTYTKNNIELVRFGVGAYTGRVFNLGRLDYAYNPITGLFMQSAYFQDPDSIADIEEQEFTGQSYLLRDPATAQKILEYTCRRSLLGANKVLFSSRFLPANCRPGQLVTIDYPEHSISGLWKIVSLQIGDHVHRIEAEKFDASIFTVGTPGTAIDWSKDPPIIPTINPGAASGLTLSTELTRAADGTNIITLSGSFTLPAERGMFAILEYGEGLEPTAWVNYCVLRGNTFKISPVKPAQIYSVRVQMASVTSRGDYITASITTAGDTEAPAAPMISVSGSMQFMQVLMTLESPPDDMAGFAVYRGTTNNPNNAVKIGTVPNTDGQARFTDRISNYNTAYYYFAKAYDDWGNLSDFSNVSPPMQAFKILDADILRQLTPAESLNTDPYFADYSAWAGDVYGSSADSRKFVIFNDGIAGATGFKSMPGEKLIFAVNHDRLIPYDSTRHYVLFAYMRATGGSHGLGFAFYNADKALLAQWSIETASVDTNFLWQRFSKAFTSVPTGTAFISPMIICNNDETAGVVLDVQKCQLREVITSDILIANEAVITNAIQILTGIINNAHIANLDAIKITSGTLDVGRLAATVAHVEQLAVIGRNLLSDPSFLEVPKGFSNGAITINGDLENVFIGESFDFGGWSIAADTSQALFSVWTSVSPLVPIGNGIHLILDLNTANRAYIGQRVKVMPLQHYSFSAYIAILETAANVDLVIAWYGGETYISRTSAQVQGDVDELQRVFVNGQAPVGATHAIVYIRLETMTGTGYRHVILSAPQFEYGEEPTAWVGREQGTITADRIFTGLLNSLNYQEPLTPGNFAESGTSYDLQTGAITSKTLRLDEDGNLKIKGDISGSSGTFSGVVGGGYIKLNSSEILTDCVDPVDQNVYIKIAKYTHGIMDMAANIQPFLRILIGVDLFEISGSCAIQYQGNGWDFAQVRVISKRSDKNYSICFYKNTSDEYLYIKIYSATGFPVTQGGTLTLGSTIKIIESIYSDDEIALVAPAGTLVLQYTETSSSNGWSSGTEWWRQHDDGWLEQGGFVAASTENEIVFLRPFANTDYTLIVTPNQAHNPGGNSCITSKTTTGAVVSHVDNGGENADRPYGKSMAIAWRACGQGA